MAEPEHGELSYLQVPATDVATSATFYREAFGWHFVAEYPASFDAPGGLMGALDTDVPVAGSGGPILWLFVTDIHQTVELVHRLGGRLVEEVNEEGPRLQATIADPAGNVIGVWQNRPA